MVQIKENEMKNALEMRLVKEEIKISHKKKTLFVLTHRRKKRQNYTSSNYYLCGGLLMIVNFYHFEFVIFICNN